MFGNYPFPKLGSARASRPVIVPPLMSLKMMSHPVDCYSSASRRPDGDAPAVRAFLEADGVDSSSRWSCDLVVRHDAPMAPHPHKIRPLKGGAACQREVRMPSSKTENRIEHHVTPSAHPPEQPGSSDSPFVAMRSTLSPSRPTLVAHQSLQATRTRIAQDTSANATYVRHSENPVALQYVAHTMSRPIAHLC